MGRWTSRDPLEEGAYLNTYVALHNNPISRIDLFGLIVSIHGSQTFQKEIFRSLQDGRSNKYGKCAKELADFAYSHEVTIKIWEFSNQQALDIKVPYFGKHPKMGPAPGFGSPYFSDEMIPEGYRYSNPIDNKEWREKGRVLIGLVSGSAINDEDFNGLSAKYTQVLYHELMHLWIMAKITCKIAHPEYFDCLNKMFCSVTRFGWDNDQSYETPISEWSNAILPDEIRGGR